MMLPQKTVESFAIDIRSLSGSRYVPRIPLKDTVHVRRLEQIHIPPLCLHKRQFARLERSRGRWERELFPFRQQLCGEIAQRNDAAFGQDTHASHYVL